MPLTQTVIDNLNDTDGTKLTAHAPQTGTGWTMLHGPSDNAEISNDSTNSGLITVWHSTTENTFYTAECAETETEAQRVTVVIGPSGNPRRFLMPSVRLSAGTTSVNGYGIEIDDTSNSIELFRFDDGVKVSIDSASSEPVTATSTVVYEITATGDHSVTLDGTLVDWDTAASTVVTDNTHTGGKFGITAERSISSISIDSFVGEYDVVGGGNQAPTANAGPDQNVDTGTLVTLDGTGSSDPDTDPLTYSWTQTAGTAVTLSDNTAAQPTFTPPSDGTYTFELVVNDGTVNSTADAVTITATTPAPSSTINLTVSGAADQAYTVNFCDATTGAQIEQKSVTFATQAGSTTLGVSAGTAIIGYLVDAAPNATEGTVVTGTTV
tara:strand:- start:19546 stop:20688 length:1143 start_codon:yes stop_codon:yes gene_type:complete